MAKYVGGLTKAGTQQLYRRAAEASMNKVMNRVLKLARAWSSGVMISVEDLRRYRPYGKVGEKNKIKSWSQTTGGGRGGAARGVGAAAFARAHPHLISVRFGEWVKNFEKDVGWDGNKIIGTLTNDTQVNGHYLAAIFRAKGGTKIKGGGMIERIGERLQNEAEILTQKEFDRALARLGTT